MSATASPPGLKGCRVNLHDLHAAAFAALHLAAQRQGDGAVAGPRQVQLMRAPRRKCIEVCGGALPGARLGVCPRSKQLIMCSWHCQVSKRVPARSPYPNSQTWRRKRGALQREQLQAGRVGQRGQQRAPARNP